MDMNENNFFSMNKLVEFGMGMAVANQMAQSMSNALNQMQVPGVGNPLQGTSQNVPEMYYAVIDGKSSGPFGISDLSRLISEKKIVKETYIWKPGLSNWTLAQNLPEVLRIVALTPPPVPQM